MPLRPLHVALIAVVLLGGSLARADDTHYQDYVIGGRAVGLGGAFASISDDPSGLYYNPAGIADVRQTNLQVSTSLYGYERGSLEDQLTLPVPGVENLDIEFTDLIVVPASAGFVKTFGATDGNGRPMQGYGISVVVPSYRSYTAAAADGVGSYLRRVTDRELWSGIGYGRRITPRLRLGVSGYYQLRSVSDREDVTSRENIAGVGDKFQAVTNDISLVCGSVILIAGAKYKLTDRINLAAVVQSPSLQVHSQARLRFSQAISDPAAAGGPRSSFERLEVNEARSHTRYAPLLRLGASYIRKYRYTFSLDATVHAPVSYTLVDVADDFRQRLPFAPRIERRPVVNVNAGAEFLLVRQVSIAGGVFTDFSSAPPIPKQPLLDQPARVNLLGLVMALGYFGEHTLSRLGVVYSFGSGHDVIPRGGDIGRVLDGGQSFKRVRYFQSFFYVFVSSTFRY